MGEDGGSLSVAGNTLAGAGGGSGGTRPQGQQRQWRGRIDGQPNREGVGAVDPGVDPGIVGGAGPGLSAGPDGDGHGRAGVSSAVVVRADDAAAPTAPAAAAAAAPEAGGGGAAAGIVAAPSGDEAEAEEEVGFVAPPRAEGLTGDDFQCNICWELLARPVTLVCGHTACESCMAKYLRAQAQAQAQIGNLRANRISCPAGELSLDSRLARCGLLFCGGRGTLLTLYFF